MPVHVEGLQEMTRAMEKAGVDVEELKDAMGSVATEAARVMEGLVPHRSGALAASVRGNRAKGRAIVTAGKARVPYAGPVNYGWPRRGIRPAAFVARTDAVMDDKAAQILEDGWADIARRNGLT